MGSIKDKVAIVGMGCTKFGDRAFAALAAVHYTSPDTGTLLPHLPVTASWVKDTGIWHRLGERYRDELSHSTNLSIEFIGNANWAGFHARPAAGALVCIHKSGFLHQPNLKITVVPVNPSHLTIGENLYIGMIVNPIH
ncbi:unnamed protein product [marine sediment metagenome]|uniref:Uncharacterized protein n=1 Tax=marine sediment metagenome TaxID=412755 RepID=X1E368_9ZZZZ